MDFYTVRDYMHKMHKIKESAKSPPDIPGFPKDWRNQIKADLADQLAAGRTHLVETTLAGSTILRHIATAQRKDYWIVLHFVSVGSPDLALDRIRNRVALGGHDVPEADVRRRFERSHASLPAAISWADVVPLYDNADPDRPYREIAVITEKLSWISEAVPDWAAAALA